MAARNLPARVAVSVGAYLAFVVLALSSFGFGLPGWLEACLSLLAFPGVILFLLWNGPLRALGLTQGEMFSAPHPAAALVIALLYCALAYGLTLGAQRLLARRRR